MTLASQLAESLLEAWKNARYIFLCGNVGSAGNAIHLANDFIYGAGVKNGKGLNVADRLFKTVLASGLSYVPPTGLSKYDRTRETQDPLG
jgi:D-sedoheptulose 7-phosphate isomerase